MSKVQVFLRETDFDLALRSLQRAGVLMIDDKYRLPATTLDEDRLLQRTNKLIELLDECRAKRQFFEHLEFDYDTFSADVQPDLVDQGEALVAELADLEGRRDQLRERVALLSPFAPLEIPTSSLFNTKYVKVVTGLIDNELLASFGQFADLHPGSLSWRNLGGGAREAAVVVALVRSQADSLMAEVVAQGLRTLELPSIEAPVAQIIADDTNQLVAVECSIKETRSRLSAFSNHLPQLKLLADKLVNIKLRKSVTFERTENFVYLCGWVRDDQRPRLESALGAVTATYEIDYIKPSADEVVPTATKSNKFSEQFDTITNMFSVPNYSELDPNPVMSLWYWFFFGIMMGDIGYGLALVLGIGAFLRLRRPKGELKKLLKIFFYGGFSTVVAGVLFGSCFGFTVDLGAIVGSWFGQSWSSIIINPIEEPLPMLIFAVACGALQIVTGLVMKMVIAWRRGDPWEVLGGLSWILVLAGAGLFVLLSALPVVGVVVAVVGLVLVFFLSGRGKKSIFGRLSSGFGGVYGISGYLSDLLSYSRILALCLSTAVIAFAMNMLAGMVQGSVVGAIFSVLIYLVGHLFNFVMGLLSTYVHDGRLQYIEFFGKFYEGGGRLFAPLAIELNHIDEVKFEVKYQ